MLVVLLVPTETPDVQVVAERFRSSTIHKGKMSDDEYGASALETTSYLMKDMAMTAKVPPSFDGKSSWFSYEELIDEWCTLTEVKEEKRGPNLRNMLKGDALTFSHC